MKGVVLGYPYRDNNNLNRVELVMFSRRYNNSEEIKCKVQKWKKAVTALYECKSAMGVTEYECCSESWKYTRIDQNMSGESAAMFSPRELSFSLPDHCCVFQREYISYFRGR